MSKISISIDDVKGIFKALNQENFTSIFETRTLAFLREMHMKYGTEFDLYCTYIDGEYSLKKVTNHYKEEFIANSDWLRFGFHCIEENGDYSSITLNEFKDIYLSFLQDLSNVTGQKTPITVLRLHKFQGNRDVCRLLHEFNVDVFLASDDIRNNYYLSKAENQILLKEGKYFDKDENILFVSSCVRLECESDLEEQINEKKVKDINLIPIFTHECKLDGEDVRRRLEECCKIEQKMRT